MRRTLRSLRRDRAGMAGLILVLLVVLVAIFAPLIAGDPHHLDPSRRLQPPSAEHWLGTDDMGRDLWTVTAFGARTSAGIAAVCTGLALVAGLVIGVLAGYFRTFDAIMMRVIDGLMSFPNIILVMSLVGVLGRGLAPVIFGLTVVLVPAMARVVRSAALSVRNAPMVESARALGATHGWVLRRYIAPETVTVLIIQATMAFAATVLSIAALSFLGIGLPPDMPSWGASLAVAQRYISLAWWLGVFPGLAILMTVLGLVLLGDGLRDAFDPRYVRRRLLRRSEQETTT